VFLLGHWKNFEELEDTLSLDELTATLDAIRRKEEREQKFHAAIQGIDLGSGSSTKEETEKQFAEIWHQASAANTEGMDEPERLAVRGIRYEVIDGEA
jgi:hypothetical protein